MRKGLGVGPQFFVNLDVYHFDARCPISASEPSKEFAREFRRALWSTSVEHREVKNILDVPQQDRWIPAVGELERRMQALRTKWNGSDIWTPVFLEWWRKAQVHISAGCISDPVGLPLNFTGQDGRVRTARGTTGSCEAFNKGAKRCSSKGYAYGVMLRASVHRAFTTLFNMNQGFHIEGWPIMHTCDLTLMDRLLAAASRVGVIQHLRSFAHPKLIMPPNPAAPRLFEEHVSPATGDYPQITWDLLVASREFASLATVDTETPLDVSNPLLPAAPNVVAEPLAEPAREAGAEEFASICIYDTATVADVLASFLEANGDELAALVRSSLRVNNTLFSLLYRGPDVLDAVTKLLAAAPNGLSDTPAVGQSLFVLLKVFATVVSSPVLLLRHPRGGCLVVTPLSTIMQIDGGLQFSGKHCYPCFVFSSAGTLRPFRSPSLELLSGRDRKRDRSDSESDRSEAGAATSGFAAGGRATVRMAGREWVRVAQGAQGVEEMTPAPGRRVNWTKYEDDFLWRAVEKNTKKEGEKNTISWVNVLKEWNTEREKMVGSATPFHEVVEQTSLVSHFQALKKRKKPG